MFGYVLLFVILPLQRNQREIPSLFLYVTFKNIFHIPIHIQRACGIDPNGSFSQALEVDLHPLQF